jgi:hypothetical protein
MKSFKSKLSAGLAFAVVTLTACGTDSTGPANLDATAALKSLAIGLQQMGADGSTATLTMDPSFAGIAPFLNQVTINIDGSSQSMFGFALRESFPDGTCEETIFPDVVPGDPTICTPPPLEVAVMLWQSHSASEPPDRMVMLAGDVGTTDFNFNLDTPSLPGVAVYLDGQNQNDLWISQSGTLTSAVTAGTQTCDIPLPPYAKSGHCSIATFDEQGSIVLTGLNNFYSINGSTGPTKTLTIPRQTLHGLWMAVTEVQPIGLTATRISPATPTLFQRLAARRGQR